MNNNLPKVSVVFPVYNEEGNLEVLYERVQEAFSNANVAYEMVFVDDCSSDGSLEIIKRLSLRDPGVRYVSLSRNFGHQGALFAGMSYASGDAVITMDSDLQHPPSLIPEMVALWLREFEVVYTTKRNQSISGLTGLQVKLFYWTMSKASGLKLAFGQSDFRLMDRKVVDVLLSIPEHRKFLRGMVDWTGFRQMGLAYDVPERYSGETKFSYRARWPMAVDGILSFSTLPLRWMLVAGLIIASLSLLYVGAMVVLGVLSLFHAGIDLTPGWATLAVAVTFFGGVQLIAVGVPGEYIGRIYEETKGRPVFIVREESDTGVVREPEAGQLPRRHM